MEVDPSIVRKAIENTSERAMGVDEVDLPHPLVTDEILAEHMDAIGHYLLATEPDESDRSLSDRLTDRAKGKNPEQDSFNSHLIHILHQFDHRTRHQQREIKELRERLDEATEQIVALKRRLGRIEPDQA